MKQRDRLFDAQRALQPDLRQAEVCLPDQRRNEHIPEVGSVAFRSTQPRCGTRRYGVISPCTDPVCEPSVIRFAILALRTVFRSLFVRSYFAFLGGFGYRQPEARCVAIPAVPAPVRHFSAGVESGHHAIHRKGAWGLDGSCCGIG